jgi:hypothetical protein
MSDKKDIDIVEKDDEKDQFDANTKKINDDEQTPFNIDRYITGDKSSQSTDDGVKKSSSTGDKSSQSTDDGGKKSSSTGSIESTESSPRNDESTETINKIAFDYVKKIIKKNRNLGKDKEELIEKLMRFEKKNNSLILKVDELEKENNKLLNEIGGLKKKGEFFEEIKYILENNKFFEEIKNVLEKYKKENNNVPNNNNNNNNNKNKHQNEKEDLQIVEAIIENDKLNYKSGNLEKLSPSMDPNKKN